MSSITNNITLKDAIRELKAAGFVEVAGAKHMKFRHPELEHMIMLPHSPKGDVIHGHMARVIWIAIAKGQESRGTSTERSRLYAKKSGTKLHERGR